MTAPRRPAACATASTPPPSASSRPPTWNAKATAPTATFSSQQTTPAPPPDYQDGNPRPARPGARGQRHPARRLPIAGHPARVRKSVEPAGGAAGDCGLQLPAGSLGLAGSVRQDEVGEAEDFAVNGDVLAFAGIDPVPDLGRPGVARAGEQPFLAARAE